jgi:transposase
MAQTISVLGIDIAKLVFHIVGMDDSGQVVLRKRLARSELLTFIANVPPLRIGMEACGSAHYWARCFREYGHEVRLIAPQFVKAYVKSPKKALSTYCVLMASFGRKVANDLGRRSYAAVGRLVICRQLSNRWLIS